MVPLVESERILLIAPNGTFDRSGSRFWNATDACCNFYRSTVDDVGYIRSLIADIREDYNVDRRRVYLVGHSNGAFMAHRLACEAAAEIAGIASLAGATFEDPSDCQPSEPVSILGIHGDADDTVLCAGGNFGSLYPGALETIMRWQIYDECAPQLMIEPTFVDLDRDTPGADTEIHRFVECARGTGVELWRIHGGAHIPTVSRDFGSRVWQWLSQHPKQ
jgi:polyhydroxybutyrate depolymerase